MRGLAIGIAAVLAAALVAGCFEGKADVHLNPDGTGKIVGEMVFRPVEPWTSRASADEAATALSDPETQMKEIVSRILKSSRGVKAWKDVSFRLTEDGRIQFKGTAYFAKLSDVKIWPDKAKRRASFGPEGDEVRLLVLNRPGSDDEDSPRRSSRKWDADKLAAAIKGLRRDYAESRAKASAEVMGLALDLRFHVPGLPDTVRGLTQEGRALAFSTSAGELLRHLDSQVADNTVLREMVLGRESLRERDVQDALSRRVFAQKGEVWARLSGRFLKAFDYDAEFQAAKDGQRAMMEKLGLVEARSSGSARTPAGESPKKGTSPKKDAGDRKPPKVPLPKDLPSIPVPISPLF
ncbi:MAG: hypothetical protein IMZ66_07120 [Planctomycetes bacterium]|nr:hypothetical protein [Planctomycetota bacterium]